MFCLVLSYSLHFFAVCIHISLALSDIQIGFYDFYCCKMSLFTLHPEILLFKQKMLNRGDSINNQNIVHIRKKQQIDGIFNNTMEGNKWKSNAHSKCMSVDLGGIGNFGWSWAHDLFEHFLAWVPVVKIFKIFSVFLFSTQHLCPTALLSPRSVERLKRYTCMKMIPFWNIALCFRHLY